MARNEKNTRMCAGCMKRADKSELVSINRDLSGHFNIGTGSHFGGRCVYVCPDETCIDKAIKRKSVSRGLRYDIPADIYNQIRQTVKSVSQE